MTSLHADSCMSLPVNLELFTVPSTNVAVDDYRYVCVGSTTAVETRSMIEFDFTFSSMEYIDLSSCFLLLKQKILKGDGTVLPSRTSAADATVPDISKVCPINAFHHTQFKSCQVYLAGKLISKNNNLYAYRSLFEMLLSNNDSSKQSQLPMGLFFLDTGNLDDNSNFKESGGAGTNTGAAKRYIRTRFSKTFQTVGKIHSDLFFQNRYLLPSTPVKIVLHRHDPKFSLMAPNNEDEYQILIEEASLYVKSVKVSPSITAAHLAVRAKEMKNVMYPLKTVEMKYWTFPQNINDLSIQKICNGSLPRKVIIGFVSSQAFNGKYKLNPLKMHHFNLEEVILKVNGENRPWETLCSDYSRDQYVLPFLSTYQGSGGLFDNFGLGIDFFDMYKNGHCLYAYDFQPECEDTNLSLIKNGILSATIKTREPLDTSVTVIVYLQFDEVLEINPAGQVTDTEQQ